jgi:hypothetical protein
MLQIVTAGAVALLNVVKTAIIAAGSLGATKMKLFQNNVVVTPATLIGDLTEATFAGYVAKTLTWAVGPYLNPAGQAEIQNGSVNWTPTDSVTPNAIYGYWVEDAAGNLLWAENFTTPRSMASTLDTITLLPTLVLVPGGLSGIVQPQDS